MGKSCSAVVAEDEETLRQELIEALGQVWPELCIVAEAADGIAALRMVAEHQPDVLFLDIQMPGATGLEVARQLSAAGGRGHIVFVTAYDQYAIDAFEAGAVDYLLKPLSMPRLFTTISRLKARLQEAPADLGDVLDKLTQEPRGAGLAPARAPLRWINASVGQTLRLLTVDEVLYFQADTKYTRVVTRDAEALIRKPLKELAEELDAQQFWQIHRSTLVNVAAIAGASRDFRGRLNLKLKERSESLLVAESYTHLFKQM
ncbi:LytR/AlgR family response regulator transcription factor [Roseateles oligotrophus]|uniref:LytTR family DNA-binding domain-containing protein n=1 Tax=Roseateles oligotrophus TaxID=1769250 RepID=A0ABT2YIR7_9BURK|nr:LytTR family DNA-binding domain-containing protein [Roseateles oligotrophus]MCV2369954.1 LytTR family DNA-binding domain-containing protein [Roseateles oligotrophus]